MAKETVEVEFKASGTDAISNAVDKTIRRLERMDRATRKSTVSFNDLVKKTTEKLVQVNPKNDFIGKGGFIDIAQMDRANKAISSGLETTKRYAKVMSVDVSRSIKEGEANFKKVQATWTKESVTSVKAQEKLAKETEKAAHVVGRSWARQGKYASESIREIGDVTKDLDKRINKNRFQFQGWALSVLFFGQALQRTFTSIAKFGISSFQEISHSVEGVVTNTDMLDGSMKYLGFTIGEALEPVIGFLIPIIESIANWVDEHPKLTAVIITGGIALGAFLTLLGLSVLSFNGLFEGVTKAITIFGKLKSMLAGMDLVSLLKTGALIAGLILVVTWIYKMQEAMGGWGEFVKSVLRGVLRVIFMLAGALWGVVMEVFNALKFIWNGLVGLVEWGINLIIKGVNELIKVMNKIPGVSIPLIPKVDFSKAMLDVQKFGGAFMDSYMSAMALEAAIEDRYLAPAKGYATEMGAVPTQGGAQQPTTNLYVQNMNVTNPAGYDDMMKEIEKQTALLTGMK